ncbi:hypothetical protein PGT21_015593 [Puccinia graminis f. sp. tritici]|uniref:Enterotoxin n=1 Tax=Puccinia graminis f. sp. tritici TaxID=56615 RepID=A0A5B0NSE4_PUCGR|nr:hypothetical protein PGT21_015593 [Puccinia graminis f. sp. tritici]
MLTVSFMALFLLRATLAGPIEFIPPSVPAPWGGAINLISASFNFLHEPQDRSPLSASPFLHEPQDRSPLSASPSPMASPSKSSAFSGPTSKKLSHPMYVQGPFDIIEYGEHRILDGQNYGQFNYTTSLIWNHPNGKQHAIAIDLSGYSSRAALFDKDMVYCLAGRFVGGIQQPADEAREPAVFFESAFDVCMGSSSAYIDKNERSLLADKVAVTGYGVVVDRQSIPGDNPNADLRVVLRHTDYHSVLKKKVEFDTVYYVPGNKMLSGIQKSIELNREWHSHITNRYPRTFQHSGNVTNFGPQWALDSRRPHLMRIGGFVQTHNSSQKSTASIASSSTSGDCEVHPFSASNVFPLPSPSSSKFAQDNPDHVEDGEVTENDKITFPGKRTAAIDAIGQPPESNQRPKRSASTLSDAQKKMKGRA